jgi:hypothetical protein
MGIAARCALDLRFASCPGTAASLRRRTAWRVSRRCTGTPVGCSIAMAFRSQRRSGRAGAPVLERLPHRLSPTHSENRFTYRMEETDGRHQSQSPATAAEPGER